MKKLAFLLISLSLTACATLKKSDVEPDIRTIPEPLSTTHDYDIYNLRVDVIRQQMATIVNDVYMAEPMPYHKIGLRLGNGLFFDLNSNLGIDLAEMFNLEEGRDFIITKTYYKADGSLSNKQTFYRRENDFFCVSNTSTPAFVSGKCLKIEQSADSLSFSKKNREMYTIASSEGQVTLSRRNRTLNKLKKNPGGQYASGVKRPGKVFHADSSVVYLDKDYLVVHDDEKREVRVYLKKIKKNRLVKTVVAGDGTILINDGKNNLGRIAREGDMLVVYAGAKKSYELSLEYNAAASAQR